MTKSTGDIEKETVFSRRRQSRTSQETKMGNAPVPIPATSSTPHQYGVPMKERRRASVAPIWAEIPKSAGGRDRDSVCVCPTQPPPAPWAPREPDSPSLTSPESLMRMLAPWGPEEGLEDDGEPLSRVCCSHPCDSSPKLKMSPRPPCDPLLVAPLSPGYLDVSMYLLL